MGNLGADCSYTPNIDSLDIKWQVLIVDRLCQPLESMQSAFRTREGLLNLFDSYRIVRDH